MVTNPDTVSPPEGYNEEADPESDNSGDLTYFSQHFAPAMPQTADFAPVPFDTEAPAFTPVAYNPQIIPFVPGGYNAQALSFMPGGYDAQAPPFVPGGFNPDALAFRPGAIHPNPQQQDEEITVHMDSQVYEPQAGSKSQSAHYFDQQVAEEPDLYAQYYERQLGEEGDDEPAR